MAKATAFPKGHDRWTEAQANALLRAVEDMFHRRDVDALVHGFTEDCVVRFAEQPERRGGAPPRAPFTAPLAPPKDHPGTQTPIGPGGKPPGQNCGGGQEDPGNGETAAGPAGAVGA